MMRIFVLVIVSMASLMTSAPADAQEERNERMQRLAVEAWTACMADEFPQDVNRLLTMDYRSDEYRRLMQDMGERRISERCFRAMPRAYRRIELGGLPFAGGLAEQAMERASEEPLVLRLSMAVIGEQAQTYSYTDQVANCIARGAPNLVADLFATEPASDEEVTALAQIAPVQDICTRDGTAIEASPIAMRAMLATAGYRILAAQDNAPVESETDA
ncbi:hypothetical protein [Aurantiacibacter aquimixticola]|uniref:Secreted protein n=1 Tax=Aurantiacibacter aquimixticola TaxID=1958945 RepID=A0A419RS27_9SPHN|nr:hypothetical protein [Aurantiacibacter aquimixticola]RJY08576.1 hypothetical protein D6201_03640 [Aurantiacibacter aquimixticola]